jgi:hypothetical protein
VLIHTYNTLQLVLMLLPQVGSHKSSGFHLLNSSQRVQQWLDNNTCKTAGPERRQVPSGGAHTTSRHLVQKQFSKKIKAAAKVLVAKDSDMYIMTVRNMATTTVCDQLKDKEPLEWARLSTLASTIREKSTLDYADQDAEAWER